MRILILVDTGIIQQLPKKLELKNYIWGMVLCAQATL